MILEMIFALNTFNAFKKVNRKYKWYHNLEITIRSYKTWFILKISMFLLIFFILNMYQITTIVPNKEIEFFGTLYNGLDYMASTMLISILVFILYLIFKTDERIEDIKFEYDLKNLTQKEVIKKYKL